MDPKPKGIPGFKIFTIITTTLSFFIVNFIFLYDSWLYPEDYPPHYSKTFSAIYTFLFLMWTWSYLITISSNKITPRNAVVLRSSGRCEKCRINKPDRAHHCSSCDICIEKMDHHCVWTDRCIGYHNYKSFLLFIGYLSIGTFFYDYLAISFFLGGKTKFNILVVLVVYVETAIVFLTTFLGVSLLLAHLFMACTNLSTIEYMQGRPFRLFWKENKEAKNPHDMGVVQNLVQIFGLNPLCWMIPGKVKEREAGVYFPRVPEV